MKFTEGLVRFILTQYLAHEYDHEIAHPSVPSVHINSFMFLLDTSQAFLALKCVECYNSAQRRKEKQAIAYPPKKIFSSANTI